MNKLLLWTLTGAVTLAILHGCDDALLPDDPVDPGEPSVEAQAAVVATPSAVAISNLFVSTGLPYEVDTDGFAAGKRRYIDRSYLFASPVPADLEGVTYIRTANGDKNVSPASGVLLSFDVAEDVVVYVAHDDRVPRPSWLTSGFTDTGADLFDSDGASGAFSLFSAPFPPGTVSLGGNAEQPQVRASMYTVLVRAVAEQPPEDAQAPTVPQGLSATAVSSSRIDLGWSASSDNVGVTGYFVYRDGAQVGAVAGTTYADEGLSPETTYEYTVAAYDAAGNVSAPSAPASATTDPGGGAGPLVVSNLTVITGKPYAVASSGLAQGGVRYVDRSYLFTSPIPAELQGLTYVRTANGDKNAAAGQAVFLSFDVNQPVTVYVAHDDRVPQPTWLAAGFVDTGLDLFDSDAVSGPFSVFSAAFGAGTVVLGSNADAPLVNASMYSVLIRGTGEPPEEDTEAPTVPTGLDATAVSSSRIDLSWNAASDNVGVTGYLVYREGAQVATVSGTEYSDTGLAPSTTYEYAVAARDAAGNVSDPSAGASATTEGATPVPGAPYPASPVIGGFTIDWGTHDRRAPGSDNWSLTWADDGHQYTSWGDGGGFGGTQFLGRVSLGVARVEGNATSYTGININGGNEPESGNSTLRGKSYGMLSLDGTLYMWVSPGSDATNWNQVLLYRSTDRGATWTALWEGWTESDGVGLPAILQFGQDYAGARDSYVYSYFINIQDPTVLDIQRPGEIVLARVHRSQIENRSAYQWFAGLDGSGAPTWTSSVGARAPVFEDPDGVGWNVSAVYNPGLERYLLITEHTESRAGNFGVYDAPEPWGPWTTVAYEEHWPGGGEVQQSAFYWNFSPKWWSAGGQGFVLVFSGNSENDSWNSVRGSFILP